MLKMTLLLCVLRTCSFPDFAMDYELVDVHLLLRRAESASVYIWWAICASISLIYNIVMGQLTLWTLSSHRAPPGLAVVRP